MSTPYQDRVEVVKNRLWPRIERLMGRIRTEVEELGFQCSTLDDKTDEEFGWAFHFHPVPTDDPEHWKPTAIGVDFEISESMVHEGEETGINFNLKFQANGGRDLARLAPYNYTPDCWVSLDDADAIDTRMQIMESQVLDGLQLALDEYQKLRDSGEISDEDED